MKEKVSPWSILILIVVYGVVMWGGPALFIIIGGIPFEYVDYSDRFHPGYFGYVGIWHTICFIAGALGFGWYSMFDRD